MPPRSDKKQKLTVYLDPALSAALADLAGHRGHSLSLVAEAAIASFLSPDADERREAVFTKRLDNLDRRIGRLERDLAISNEAFALFMRSWLTAPPSPDAANAAARAQAAARYDQFVAALGRRLASGRTIRHEIAEDVAASDSSQGSRVG